jgi:hypothetical protein
VLNPATTYCYGTVTTNTSNSTNVKISGSGVIVANGAVNLNASANNATRVLNITPSGGDIVIIAKTNLTVGNGGSVVNATTTDTAGIRMYSASTGVTTGLVTITGSGVNMNSGGSAYNKMLILAKRRLYVQSASKLYHSTLFVDYPANITNNVLNITASGTTVGSTSAPCSVISIAMANPALIINSGASVTGLVYQYDSANSGTTRITGATSGVVANIRGSLIANQFYNNVIGTAGSTTTITYDPTAIPDPPPEGFGGFATKEPNSWSGN